jgi:hypothetical protein
MLTYEKMIMALRHQLHADICVTSVLSGLTDHRYPWEDKLAARLWSRLISQAKYSDIRDDAARVFTAFAQRHLLCPTVHAVREGLSLTYIVGLKAVVWSFESGKQPHYRIMLAKDYQEHDVIDDEHFEHMIDLTIRYLNGEVAVRLEEC